MGEIGMKEVEDINEMDMDNANELAPIRKEFSPKIRELMALKSNVEYAAFAKKNGVEEPVKYLIENYYKFPFTLFNVFRALQDRESVFMKEVDGKIVPMRPMRVYNTQSMDYHFRNLGVYRYPFKIYHSLFKVDWDVLGAPPKNLFASKEWVEYRKQVGDRWEDALVGYDFVLDIDADSFEKAREWAMAIHLFLAEERVDHTVNFSGRNFHVRVPYDFVTCPWDKLYKMSPNLAKKIADGARVPFSKGKGIDASIYDRRRIIKCPYTVSDGRVVLPVNEWQLGSYNLEDYDLHNVNTHIKLMNRRCEFRYGGDTTAALERLVR